MAKKHWIYIKRGLSEDPKHRAQMGECIWLYMHIIDRADWEMGIAYDWKDPQEAADMGMPIDTLRRQRQKLDDLGYISCMQMQHGQNITIYEWRNPRDYGAEIKNPRPQGMHERPPSEIEGDNQGSNEGLNQVTLQVGTPTSSSKSKSSSGKGSPSKEKTKLLQNAGMDWKLASGASNEELAALAENERHSKEITDAYEQAMGYNPLPWAKLERLRKFLMTQSIDEIKAFALWSKSKYSSLNPVKARMNPDMVIDLWPQAFTAPTSSTPLWHDDTEGIVPPPERKK